MSNPPWWKWVVMFSCTCSLFLGGSQTFSCGVFHVALLEHYKQDVVETAWLGSLFASMFALTGPISSFVIHLTSYRACVMLGSLLILLGFVISSFIAEMRWLFLTYAAMIGLGEGMVYVGSIVAFSVYFPGQVSMASGVGLAGLSLGVFVFPPLAQILLDHYGLQGCFLLMGAAGFQTAVFGALMRPCTPQLHNSEITEARESKFRKIFRTRSRENGSFFDLLKPSFLLFVLSTYCFSGGLYVNYLYLPDFWIKHGSTPREASFLFTVAGASGVLSRMISGFAANDKNIGPTLIYFGAYGVAAILQFFIVSICVTLGGKIAYSLMFGLYCSTGWVLISPTTMMILGPKTFTTALGLVMLSCGMGALTVPPLTGLIGEHFGGYPVIFKLSGLCFGCTSVCAFLMMPLLKTREQEQEQEQEVGDVEKEEQAHHVTDPML